MIELRDYMTVELIQRVGDDSMIANAALVSTGRDLKDTPEEKRNGLISYLMKQKHGTPFEHGSLTYRIEAPIFVFREFHRHRIGWSYNEVSGRYSELQPVFWYPKLDRPITPIAGYKPARPQFVPDENIADNARYSLKQIYEKAWVSYQEMLRDRVAKEVARACLPLGIFSSMYATCNPRSLMNFLSLRTHDEEAAHVSYPQKEIEEVARLMESHFSVYWPVTHQAFVNCKRVAP